MPADAGLSGAWANEIDATEAGAYAMALAAIELVRGLVAIRRAETFTGADFYLGHQMTPPLDLENAIRLEVSGLSGGTPVTLRTRMRAKLGQAAAGKSNLPAVAIVVGFALKKILCADLRSP